MKPKQESRSALIVSVMRALHSLKDPDPIIDDPYGMEFVPAEERAAMGRWLVANAVEAGVAADQIPRLGDDALVRLLRFLEGYGNVILRTRYAEDRLALALKQGLAQYVIVGAGFDSFCFRRPGLGTSLTIFEIDHPATQTMKRMRMADAGLEAPDNVVYLPVDLAQETVEEALAASDFDRDRPSFFSFLGVSPYLSQQANLELFRSIAESAAADVELVFNYVSSGGAGKRAGPSPERRVKIQSAEPILSRFAPGEIRASLEDCGFALVEELGADEAVERYCVGRTDGLRPGASFRIVHARRPASAAGAGPSPGR